MSSDTKVPQTDEGSNGAPEAVVAGRATQEQIRAIDIAASIEGSRRGPWLVEVAYARALEVIEQHSKQVVKDSAAA